MTRKQCPMCASTGKIHIDPKRPCGRPDHWIACPTCETRRLRAEVRRLRRALRETRALTLHPETFGAADSLRRIGATCDAALARRRRTK